MVTAALLPTEEGIGFSLKSPSLGDYKVAVEFHGNATPPLWERIFNSTLFQEWIDTYSAPNRLRLKSVSLQNVEFLMTPSSNQGEQIKSLLMNVEALDKDNEMIKGPVKLKPLNRGVLLLLRNSETRIDSCIFVKKPNLSLGLTDCLEIPQGQFDIEGKFVGPVADLIHEHLNLVITKKDLINLTRLAFGTECRGVATHSSWQDKIEQDASNDVDPTELYLYRCNMSQQAIADLENRIGRSRRFGKPPRTAGSVKREGIQLSLVQLGDAWRATADARSIAALFLVHELRYHQLMPKFRNILLDDGYAKNDERSYDAPMKTASYMRVVDLQPQMKGINLRLKVYSPIIIERETEIRLGKTIREGVMVVGDSEGIITAKLVDHQLDLPVIVGTPILVRNGQIRMDDGHMRLFIDRWGKISADIPESERNNFNFTINPEKDMSASEYELVLQIDNQDQEDDIRAKPGGNNQRRGGRNGGGRGRGVRRG